MNGSQSILKKDNLGKFIRIWGTLLGFILLFIVFSIMKPGVFPTVRNLRNVIEQVATLAIVASGVTVVMVTGDFDLSVGSAASFVGISTAMMMKSGLPVPVCIAAGLVLGICAGLVNGICVAYGGLSAFVGTLATMTAFGGLALLLSGGTTIFALPEGFSILGQGSFGFIPLPVIIMVLSLFSVYALLEHTVYGRRLYAIGGNAEASYLSGIDTKRIRLISFCISGFFSALGGIVLTSRLASAHPQAGDPFMLNAAAAVFLGMTAFKEGEPNLWGTLLGVLIMGVMGNGMNILGINSYIQSILTGIIIILAVLLSSLAKRKA